MRIPGAERLALAVLRLLVEVGAAHRASLWALSTRYAGAAAACRVSTPCFQYSSPFVPTPVLTVCPQGTRVRTRAPLSTHSFPPAFVGDARPRAGYRTCSIARSTCEDYCRHVRYPGEGLTARVVRRAGRPRAASRAPRPSGRGAQAALQLGQDGRCNAPPS